MDRLGQDPGEDCAAPDPLEQLWRRALRVQMREIEAALQRLPDPKYGLCEQCREPIAAERLYAMPWARKCFPCQTAGRNEREMLLRSGFVPSYWY